MAKIGRFITDPKVGAYCQITLDSGEKIVVHHEKGGFKGGHLAVELPRFLGLSSTRIFTCDLDEPGGQLVLRRLVEGATPGTASATPLGAFVQHLSACDSVEAVKRTCAALVAGAPR
jgi:hypothetical protein